MYRTDPLTTYSPSSISYINPNFASRKSLPTCYSGDPFCSEVPQGHEFEKLTSSIQHEENYNSYGKSLVKVESNPEAFKISSQKQSEDNDIAAMIRQ